MSDLKEANKMEKNFVKYLSPGSFVSEETIKPIDSWDVKTAIEMAREIKERHGATPYGFVFITKSRTDEELDSSITETSPMHYLGGKVYTLQEIKERKNRNDEILIRNMECNGWDCVIENNNSYKYTAIFKDNDILLDIKF